MNDIPKAFAYIFVSTILLGILVIISSRIVHHDEYVVVSTKDAKSVFTKREKCYLFVEHQRDFLLFCLWEIENNKVLHFEISPQNVSEVQEGDVLTYEQLEQLKGRSILGRTWDLLKTPR